MVRELERVPQTSEFPETAPAANPVFFRTYSRRTKEGRETWNEVCDRTIRGLSKLGKLTPQEADLINKMQRQLKSLTSGRWLWVGGTPWIEKPENFSGGYNCTSTNVIDWHAFGLMMDLAMMGCGTGAVLEPQYINQLPPIRNRLIVTLHSEIGTTPVLERNEQTEVKVEDDSRCGQGSSRVCIRVGDSRQGWVKSYQTLLELSTDERLSGEVQVSIDLSDVRATGEPLKGFGGVANPVKLPELYERCAAILNQAIGRQLNSVECCLLIDEAAVVVVAGNVRRSAGMRQGSNDDQRFVNAKGSLWHQDENGNWRIDPERDALRMANHTHVFHQKPTLNQCIEAVRQQYYSGEGAIQWAGEAIARANCDLLKTIELKTDFLKAYDQGKAQQWFEARYPSMDTLELNHRLARYGLNPCFTGETLVAVADGRQAVSFEQLAKEGKDVPVYTLDSQGRITVRWMRHPRITGDQQSILKVTFDDGLTVRCTPNHKFVMKDGSYKAAESLQYGDAIEAMTKYHHIRGGKPNYIFISNGKTRIQAEHRLMAEFLNNQEIAATGREICNKGQFVTWQDLEHEQKRKEQIQVFNDLKLELGRLPKQEEWMQACHAEGVSARLGKFSRNFRNISELVKAASEANHRVISVELERCATVYNGTVDEFHNFYVGHHNIQNEEGKPKFSYVNVLNCGEIVFSDGHCNLSEIHLNQIDPYNYKEQEEAFTAGALSVAALLHHKFIEERYQKSRELDPIVGVSFTGLFDFFVAAFGVDWLRWWAAGRPETVQGLEFKRQEEEYLNRWREIVDRAVWNYCDRHNLKRPNRCTTVQPSGTKSLLTGASPGWHPPKAQRFLRRITFGKNDPVALACIDYGYNIVPSQSDKDESGNLLNDPFDPRCSEWLVEIPVAVPWADLPGADQIEISQFNAIAQMDFYMQVQQHYVRHNTSATIELRENEVEALGTRIYKAIKDDEGYISVALLARFDDHQTFPRLPFEPITKDQYQQLMKEVVKRRKTDDFHAALSCYDLGELTEAGPAGCDTDKCLFPLAQPK